VSLADLMPDPVKGARDGAQARRLNVELQSRFRKAWGPRTKKPRSIVLRSRVTPPLADRRQMFLVDAINLGLHLGMPALAQDGEFAGQPSRAKPVE
jgi:hypothetical protein